jgi:hypothetical protein
MGALTGRISPLGYFVRGKVENWNQVLDNLTRRRFQELAPGSDRQQSFGWVNLLDPFSTEFTKSSIFFGESLVGLSLRVDTITVPASQVKLHLARRVRLAAAEAGKERLSKNEVAALKQDLVAQMSRKVLPTIKLFDLAYHADIGRVWFFGKAKGVVQNFLELFYETFGLVLVPDSPFTVARELAGEAKADALVELEPARFSSEQS